MTQPSSGKFNVCRLRECVAPDDCRASISLEAEMLPFCVGGMSHIQKGKEVAL